MVCGMKRAGGEEEGEGEEGFALCVCSSPASHASERWGAEGGEAASAVSAPEPSLCPGVM